MEPGWQQDGTQLRYGPTGKPQRVKSHGYHWCAATEDAFFEVLAASCNVSLAAATVGFATPTVYRYRQLRPEFAARWQAALETGYARLEMELLRAATDSLADAPFGPDRPIPKMTVEQAMNVLRAHRHEVRGAGKRGPGAGAQRRRLEDVRDSITKKVAAIRNQRPDAV